MYGSCTSRARPATGRARRRVSASLPSVLPQASSGASYLSVTCFALYAPSRRSSGSVCRDRAADAFCSSAAYAWTLMLWREKCGIQPGLEGGRCQ